ncbi:acyl-ACP--UDP-N-acetylglucosamine O-acyltransferase [Adhaeribacter aquaticus]|uniref:acyl-ACP--UDP-N-acetylglucosamine O-acyltransferase n=1 Tax=Adhaeribacter aquaticus TaxID=299567 RepID=UPI0004164E6B|nr:acyl-ACP--UDP-N-acetylglucosamine O-acyltransferase [Adhaeribacter aquaticus]
MNQPLAYIHPEAKIAENAVVEPFSTIYKNVEIGEGTWIGPNVTIMEGARIGKNCKIYPGAVISAAPQDLKYKGEPSTVQIGDNTVIRECVTINRGTALDKNTTKIGSNCLIMAYVHVAHDCIIGDSVIVANSVQLAGHIEIQDFVFIGGTTAVQQFVKIGAHTMIGGGSLVRKDVPPFIKAAREPLSYAGINSVGLRRRGYTNEKINEIQQIYRILFLNGLNYAAALDKIELDLPPSDERDEIVNFFRSSERGVIRGYTPKDAD